MKKWITKFIHTLFRSSDANFYYIKEMKQFEELKDSQRERYLYSFSKAA